MLPAAPRPSVQPLHFAPILGAPNDAAGGPPTKPVVEVPAGPSPDDLLIEDLVVGTGDEAVSGKQVTVEYVGVAHSTGEQFDASWDRGQSFRFFLGAGRGVKGWDQGGAGLKG